MASSDLATAFTIRELTGDQRSIRLTGRALPHRPFELRGTQRHDLTWYPGSPVGTLQMFGAKEEPTTIRGMWKDKYLGGSGQTTSIVQGIEEFLPETGETVFAINDQLVSNVRQLTDTIDDIRRKGQLVEVTWLHQVRRGIVGDFVQRWMTGHDVEWEMTFVWNSQAESLDDVSMVDAAATDISDLPNIVQNAVDQLTLDGAESTGGIASQFARARTYLSQAAGAVNLATDTLQELADSLQDAAVQSVRSVLAPGEALLRSVGILDEIKIQAKGLDDLIQGQLDGFALNVESTFGDQLAARAGLRVRAHVARDLCGNVAGQQSRLISASSGTLLAFHQATGEQDLRQVSTMYYGTPDEWRGLMQFNHLESSELIAGQIVFVPPTPPRHTC